jgi:hypothetical protein
MSSRTQMTRPAMAKPYSLRAIASSDNVPYAKPAPCNHRRPLLMIS